MIPFDALCEKLPRGGEVDIAPATIASVRQGDSVLALIDGNNNQQLDIPDDSTTGGAVTVTLASGVEIILVDEQRCRPDGLATWGTAARLLDAMRRYGSWVAGG